MRERIQVAVALALLLLVVLACRRSVRSDSAADASASASSSARALPNAPPLYTVIGDLTKSPGDLAVSQEKETFKGHSYTVYHYEYPRGIAIAEFELHVRDSTHDAWTVIVREPYAAKLAAEDFAPSGGVKLQTGNEVDNSENTLSLVYDLSSGPLRNSVLWLRGDHVLVIKSHKEAYN